MHIFTIPLAIFLVSFFTQKIIFTHAERRICKVIPLMISLVLLILWRISYHVAIHLIWNSGYAATYRCDGAEMAHMILGILVLISIAGCIFGIVYAAIKEAMLKKAK